ncbi:alpha/beta hydrolase family protein [Williamsia muralis]|uniref:alpha/beta hydrolase family protein n=1 Tax=Williamsia marianensis TaxID=85044 RepID=UPI0037FCB9D0
MTEIVAALHRRKFVPVRWSALAAAAVITSAVVSCSSGTDDGSKGDTAPVKAGRVLSAAVVDGPVALRDAAQTKLITYSSEDASGNAIVVSGTVAVPRTPAPAGGYPVISWAHGTTGVADACAPSAAFDGGPTQAYLTEVDAALNDWLSKGFAVVRTDYEGLGTPGVHPYVNADSEVNALTDIVRAARELDQSIGTDWYAVGHSQGGQAALFVAADAPERAPELDLRAAAAIAPGSGLDRLPEYFKSGVPGIAAAQSFLPLILLGAQAADPSIRPEDLLTDQARPLLDSARTGCLDDIRRVPPVVDGQVFRADADLGPLTDYMTKQEPAAVKVVVPTMIAQSSTDAVVPKSGTDVLVDTLCARGNQIDYRLYEGADHRQTIGASLGDIQSFVSAVETGAPAADGC